MAKLSDYKGLEVSDISREEVGEWLSTGNQFGAQIGAWIPWKLKHLLVQAADKEDVPMSVLVRRALMREVGIVLPGEYESSVNSNHRIEGDE